MPREGLLERLKEVGDEIDYLAHHTKSFRLVTRFFAPRAERRMARAYAWCRFLDDLVDDPGVHPASTTAMLDTWMELSRAAYAGHRTGVPIVDNAMADMARASVPFTYAEELAEGMRMDLRKERYASMEDLSAYTYRVASVVGLWVAELFSVRDPVVLGQAARLGHALQVTNIIRDVGEDLRIGRCYLPADMMARHGVTEEGLAAGVVPPGYRVLLDEMIFHARAAFDESIRGLAGLPRTVRIPIAVAVHVYRGLLGEICRNGYDNLGRRAELSAARRTLLGARAVLESAAAPLRRRAQATHAGGRSEEPVSDPRPALAGEG